MAQAGLSVRLCASQMPTFFSSSMLFPTLRAETATANSIIDLPHACSVLLSILAGVIFRFCIGEKPARVKSRHDARH